MLTGDEWARVIYHLCKHRGFHWTSRAEEKQADGDSKGESGKVKQGLAGTAKLMKEKGYRSTAEMVLAEFPEAQRNKQGDYGKALSRVLLGEELALLFQKQRELGNPHTDAALEQAILGDGDRKNGLFWAQKPALAGMDSSMRCSSSLMGPVSAVTRCGTMAGGAREGRRNSGRWRRPCSK